MKPKDKAKQLLESFNIVHIIKMSKKGSGLPVSMYDDQIKACAIKCADELIQAFTQLSIEESGTTHIDFGHGYWKEVRREIEKL